MEKETDKPKKTKQITKKRRFKPGTVSIREIKNLQKSTNLLIQKLPFKNLLKYTIQELDLPNVKISEKATDILHEVTEHHLMKIFQDANKITLQSNRVCVAGKDYQLARAIRKERD